MLLSSDSGLSGNMTLNASFHSNIICPSTASMSVIAAANCFNNRLSASKVSADVASAGPGVEDRDSAGEFYVIVQHSVILTQYISVPFFRLRQLRQPWEVAQKEEDWLLTTSCIYLKAAGRWSVTVLILII